CARPSTRFWSTPAPARTRAIRRRSTSRSSRGSTASRPPACFEDIDYVFCTHLHIDHTGWNTMLRDGRWVPTFPRAKYIFHKGEYAHWEEMTKQGANPPGNVWTFNCRPIVEAGQALLVDDTFELDDTFSLTPTPGHSPHHCR